MIDDVRHRLNKCSENHNFSETKDLKKKSVNNMISKQYPEQPSKKLIECFFRKYLNISQQ